MEAGGVSVTPLAPLLVSIHSISSVTGCFGSHALVHLAQRGCMDSLSVINHLYFGKPHWAGVGGNTEAALAREEKGMCGVSPGKA